MSGVIAVLARLATRLDRLAAAEAGELGLVPVPTSTVALAIATLGFLLVAAGERSRSSVAWDRNATRRRVGEAAAWLLLLAAPLVGLIGWMDRLGSLGATAAFLPVVAAIVLHARGRLGPATLLAGAVLLAASASFPEARTIADGEKLGAPLLSFIGWGKRLFGVYAALVLALLAFRVGRGSMCGVAGAVVLWLTTCLVRVAAGAWLPRAFALEQPSFEVLADLDRWAALADVAFAAVVAVGVLALALPWLRERQGVIRPALLLAAGLLSTGPQHDPWLVQSDPASPWVDAGVDDPIVVDAGWRLPRGADATAVAVLPGATIDERRETTSDLTVIYAHRDATVDEVVAAAVGDGPHYLAGPRFDPAPVRSAARRWPAVDAILAGEQYTVRVKADGTFGCPYEDGPAPRAGERVTDYLARFHCGGPAQRFEIATKDAGRRWLYLPRLWPEDAVWSVAVGLLLAFAFLTLWGVGQLHHFRGATPSSKPPVADAPVHPMWVAPDAATTRWVKTVDGSPYRSGDEPLFVGPRSPRAALRTLFERSGRGLGISLATLGAIAAFVTLVALMWADAMR